MDTTCALPIPDSPYLAGCPATPTPDPVTTIGQVGPDDDTTIPIGALDWSLTIIGAAGEVNGIAMGTGTTLSGTGPLDTAITLEAGATTTINYSYSI